MKSIQDIFPEVPLEMVFNLKLRSFQRGTQNNFQRIDNSIKQNNNHKFNGNLGKEGGLKKYIIKQKNYKKQTTRKCQTNVNSGYLPRSLTHPTSSLQESSVKMGFSFYK